MGLQQQATEPALLEAKSASKTIQMHSKVKKVKLDKQQEKDAEG